MGSAASVARRTSAGYSSSFDMHTKTELGWGHKELLLNTRACLPLAEEYIVRKSHDGSVRWLGDTPKWRLVKRKMQTFQFLKMLGEEARD